MILTEVFSSGIAILLQFAWWFSSIMASGAKLSGSISKFDLVCRHNTVFGRDEFMLSRNDFIFNRIFFFIAAIVITAITAYVYELKRGGRKLYTAAYKTVEIPPLIKSVLEEYLKGQAQVNIKLDTTREMSHLMRRLVRNIVMGLWVMALLIGSSIICTTDMHPQMLGIPALGFFGFMLAFAGKKSSPSSGIVFSSTLKRPIFR